MAEEVEVYEHAPVTLFGTDDPAQVMVQATAVAKQLAKVVEDQKLYAELKTKQGPRRHVKVEGWTLLGSLLGVYPVTIWTRELVDEEAHVHLGWEARVEAVTRSGSIVGAAEAECRWAEERWRTRDSYALRSMAQTRAASKALRMPLGFVMQLAGFEATPAEEMPTPDETLPPERTPLSSLTLDNLRAELKKVETVAVWQEQNVVEHASRKFGRPITAIEDLSEEEAQIIITGILEWRIANHVEPTPAAEDFTREGQ